MDPNVQPVSPATSPFDRLSQGLGLWPEQARRHGRGFIAMSAGVNWSPPSPAVLTLLKLELALSMTTRNYGHAGGLRPVTRALEFVEDRLHGLNGCAVMLTHGTTEAAWLALQDFQGSGAIARGDRALAIGHTFPLYHRLSLDHDLDFYECLGMTDSSDRFMPRPQNVAAALERLKPRLIFLVLPNNPLGELICPESLQHIVAHVRRHDGRLLVDRVCLMPWDAFDALAALVGPLVLEGKAVMVDSFSKSESLAGLRTGYMVSDSGTKARVVESIKSRFLNPPPFGAATLALTRLAMLGTRTGCRVLSTFAKAQDELFSEYPAQEEFRTFFDAAIESLPHLALGTAVRRRLLRRNFARLEERFAGSVSRPLRLEAGFNVAFALDAMDARREAVDQRELAVAHGVGVLTSSSFCVAPPGRRYFIRIGLTLNAVDFDVGLARLHSYFSNLR
jgi:aspartate/methionine/tyrosine aminotransferase